MSETGGGLREWAFHLDDMIGFAEDDTLWSIVQGDVPALLPLLRELRACSGSLPP